MTHVDPLKVAKPFYDEPQRHFHTWEHIENLLALFEEWKHELNRPEAIKLAILFHDAVYQPGDPENEAKSAALLREQLPDAENLEFACDVILSTKEHKVSNTIPAELIRDCQFMLDMDMSIVGSAPDVYECYAEQIRKEFSFVPQDAFNAGRRAFLEDLLAREEIFYTPEFKERYEQQARANAKRELDQISK